MAGSRSPSRFRLGPESTRIVAIGSACHADGTEGALEHGAWGIVDQLKPVWSGEHEGELVAGLLVAAHHREQFVGAALLGDSGGESQRDDAVVNRGDRVVVDSFQRAGEV